MRTKFVCGSTTEISGDLGNAWWTNNATDKMIRDLINDYDTVIFDQFGQMVMNARPPLLPSNRKSMTTAPSPSAR